MTISRRFVPVICALWFLQKWIKIIQSIFYKWCLLVLFVLRKYLHSYKRLSANWKLKKVNFHFQTWKSLQNISNPASRALHNCVDKIPFRQFVWYWPLLASFHHISDFTRRAKVFYFRKLVKWHIFYSVSLQKLLCCSHRLYQGNPSFWRPILTCGRSLDQGLSWCCSRGQSRSGVNTP
jgi:hypothetical protein